MANALAESGYAGTLALLRSLVMLFKVNRFSYMDIFKREHRLSITDRRIAELFIECIE